VSGDHSVAPLDLLDPLIEGYASVRTLPPDYQQPIALAAIRRALPLLRR